MESNELYHYGIKGMKWGVRRTPAQLGRSSGKKKSKTYGWSEDAKRANVIKKKSVEQMSNNELRELNKRMELEQNYKRLNPSKIRKGLAIAGTVAGAIGTANAIYNNGNNLINNGRKVVNLAKKAANRR